MKKIKYTWQQLQGDCITILRTMHVQGYKPDIILGVSRGGMVPGILMSQYLHIPLYPITISLRDHNQSIVFDHSIFTSPDLKVLVVDDINDSGETLTKIIESLPPASIKTATIFEKPYSKFSVDYSAIEIYDEWVVFPWEDFWTTE